MHDFQFFGGWMMFFWWFLIIALVVIVIRTLFNTNQSKETPMDILKRRYAEGEIDEEEFNKRKKELLK